MRRTSRWCMRAARRANARAKARLGAPQRFQYGASEIESVDVYRTKKNPDNAPINVYIHGGAWRNGRSADFAFLSEMIVDAGAHIVIADFSNIDDVGGNLMTMAKQVRSAVAWVYNNAQKFGGDKNRLYVTGHSSGGHLTSTIVTCDWRQGFRPAEGHRERRDAGVRHV